MFAVEIRVKIKFRIEFQLAVVLALVLSSCNTNTSSLPACVEEDCNCSDFATQAEAQQVLEAVKGDPHGLDRDGNGKACEGLGKGVGSREVGSSGESGNRQSGIGNRGEEKGTKITQKNEERGENKKTNDSPYSLLPTPYSLSSNDSPSIHLKFGNPSNANPSNTNNYLLLKPQYAIGYDCSQNQAKWVSWQLSRDWLGDIGRSNDFRPDPDVPCYQVHPRDYKGSGYDRGHIVASADRDRTENDNSATYLMSNMMPQAPQNNREVWREFEEYLRGLVGQGKELYVIAGGEGSQGSIGNNVNVPRYTWKAALVLGNGKPEKILAVRMPNDKSVAGTDWEDWQVTVDMLEVATGLDLFEKLPNNVEEALENRRE